MAIKESEILALLKSASLDVVRGQDGSLSLEFTDAAHSPWKFTVPITKVRSSDGATVMCGGSFSLLHGLPAYFTQHLMAMETSTNTDCFTLSLDFIGASCPPSRYMRKAFVHYIAQQHPKISAVCVNNRVSVSGAPKFLNELLEQLGTPRARSFLHWKASSLQHGTDGAASGATTQDTPSPSAEPHGPGCHLRRV